MFVIQAEASVRFVIANMTFGVYSPLIEYPVTISAGTGIESVFLSTNANATSGSASGTNFEEGNTVYGFVTLKDGYNPDPDWTNVSGNVYRVGSKTSLAKAEDFGTINAPSTISYSIAYELDGGSITGTNPTGYDVESETFTLINPTKPGYTFTGWSGTGIADKEMTVSIAKGSIGGREYTANWTEAQYSITYLDGGSTTVYSGDNFDSLVKTHTYNSTTELVAGTKPGNIFGGWFDNSECEGEPITSIGATDYTDNFTLYAKWTVKDAVQDVINKINAIGEVSYPGSGDTINAARTAYDALPAADQGGVENYSALTAAETEYENQKLAGVSDVEDLINAIGVVEDTAECKAKIDAARNGYDALTDEQKDLVSNYQTLLDAEAAYKALHDPAMANATKALIDAIGTVEYTDACKAKIDAARASYDALENDDQRALVTNYQTLLDAEAAYAKLDADHKAADNVKTLISAIGTVEDTAACKAKIDAARAAYDALTPDQKALVTNYQDLLNAEAQYIALHDKNIADAAKALINAIGTVEYTDACKAKIDAARAAYDALTADQKALVDAETLKVLTDAEAAYTKLVADHKTADNAKTLISAIGTVEYTDACKAKIDAARAAYDALTPDQKALVGAETLKVLTDAEAAYGKLKADHDAAEAVEELVEEIGDIDLSTATKESIKEAREAYEALTPEQKALVGDKFLKDLESAEKILDVMEKIDAIGNVEHTDACKQKIDSAREAYEALTAEEKQQVTNYDVLVEAERTYTHVHQVIKKIDDIGDVHFNNDSKTKIEDARTSYETLTEEEKTLVTNYETLVKAEQKYQSLTKEHNTCVGLGIGFGIFGGIVLLLCAAYALMMFAFNRWIKREEKALRAFKLFGLKKDGKPLLLVFPVRFESRNEDEIFKSKEDALK